MGQSAGPGGQRHDSDSQSAFSAVCLGESPSPSLGLHLSTWKNERLIQDALETMRLRSIASLSLGGLSGLPASAALS